MENIKDILDNFDELSFTEKLVLKKRLRIDTFIAERKGDTLQSIGINLMLVGKYFDSVGKKEFWFFPLNENDYNAYLKWIFANEYLDYNSFDTLKKNFLDRFDKHRFKEKLISELILEYEKRLSGEIQGSTFNWLRNKEYYKLGVVLFEEGSELNYNHFKSFYYKRWSDDATLSLSGTFTEILSCFLKGYFECQFYLFLIEQQKRLLNGEDITRPFGVEEKENEEIKTTLSGTEIWLVEFFETGNIDYSFPKHQTKPNHAKIVAEKYGFLVDSDSLDSYKKYAEQIIDKNHKFTPNQKKPKFKNLRNVKTYFESKQKIEQANKVNDFIELNYSDFI